MDSGHILRLAGALAVIAFSFFSSVAYYILNAGEIALKSPWVEQAYQKTIDLSENMSKDAVGTQIEDFETQIGQSFANATTSDIFQSQLPLSPSDAPEVDVQASSSPSVTVTPTEETPTTKTVSPISTQNPAATSQNTQTTSQQPAPVSQPVTQDITGLPTPFNTILGDTEDAVVNILCTSQDGNLITVSTGSGVIVDPSGIILTNSHVAQDLLFTDAAHPPVKDCTIRQGHLIASLYKASVLYIPLSWAQANQGLDENSSPQGNGQGDYALLAITKSATGGSLPSSFPFISPVTTYRDPKNESVLAIGYPAESIQGSIQAGVPEKYSLTSVQTTFTLSGSTADVFQTAVNPVAQRGSSGGAIVDKNGDLLGLIVSVENPTINDGSEALEAISVPYIFQNFASAGISLAGVAANPKATAQDFAPTGVQIRDLVQ